MKDNYAMAFDPSDDIRRLSSKALARLDMIATDPAWDIKQPRRQLRRLLDHIDSLSDEIQSLQNPGKDEEP